MIQRPRFGSCAISMRWPVMALRARGGSMRAVSAAGLVDCRSTESRPLGGMLLEEALERSR